MNLNILQNFRHEIYSCFERAADALFNTADALLTETDELIGEGWHDLLPP